MGGGGDFGEDWEDGTEEVEEFHGYIYNNIDLVFANMRSSGLL